MRTRIEAVVLQGDGEFSEDIQAVFDELRRSGIDTFSGECAPPLDVYETDDAVVIRVDLPGVEARTVRIVIRGTTVLVAGVKLPRRGRGDASFHLVERGFGRFARIVRLTAPCNTGGSHATLTSGQLTLTLPKINERRAQRAIVVPVTGS